MKKNIVIALLTLVSITFIVYSKIKVTEAENASINFQVALQEAKRLQNEAVQLKERMLDAAAEAIKQERESGRLMAELQKCQSK